MAVRRRQVSQILGRQSVWLARVGAVWCLSSLLAFTASCSNGRQRLYPVEGTVVDGSSQPAVNAVVVFHPSEPDLLPRLRPRGRVDESGRFKVTTYQEGDGAPAGRYNVTVFWQRPQTSPFDGDGPDILAGRYNDPKSPQVTFTVEANRSNVVPEIQVQLPSGKK